MWMKRILPHISCLLLPFTFTIDSKGRVRRLLQGILDLHHFVPWQWSRLSTWIAAEILYKVFRGVAKELRGFGFSHSAGVFEFHLVILINGKHTSQCGVRWCDACSWISNAWTDCWFRDRKIIIATGVWEHGMVLKRGSIQLMAYERKPL